MSSTYICCIHIVIIYKRIYFTVTYVKWPLIVTCPSVYFISLRHTRCAPQTGNPDNRVALWECVKSRMIAKTTAAWPTTRNSLGSKWDQTRHKHQHQNCLLVIRCRTIIYKEGMQSWCATNTAICVRNLGDY